MSSIVQIKAVTEIIHNNLILNDPEFMQQYALDHGTKGLNDLINLMGNQEEFYDQL